MIWVGGDDVDWVIGQFFQCVQVGMGCRWQVVLVGDVVGVFGLVWEFQVYWGVFFLVLGVQWCVFGVFVVVFVCDVDFQFFYVIEYVEFGDVQVVDVVDGYGVFECDDVYLVVVMWMVG